MFGALIGGFSVWYAQRTEQYQAATGVGRALVVEMLNNSHALRAFAMTSANNLGSVPGSGIFPKLSRSVFDQHLSALAYLLKFDDLRRVTLPYTGAGYGTYLMLEAVILAKPQPLDTKSLKTISDIGLMFLDALDVLKPFVLTKKECKKFENECI